MKKTLVAGATGLLGRHLIPLLAEESEVHVVMRGCEGTTGGPAVHLLDLAGDFSTAALPTEIDTIIYLAQSDHFREFPEKAADILAVNVTAPLRLLDYARRAGARQFIYVSSGAVYRPSLRPLSEQSALGAPGELGFYGATKLAAETLAMSFSPLIDVVVLRPFFIYGPGQKPQMLIPRLIDQVRAGRKVLLQGQDGITINPIHASDAARAVRAALRLEGSHIINLAGPEALSLRRIGDEIGRQLGREPAYESADPAPDVVAEIAQMCAMLETPAQRFADRLPDMIGSQN